MKKILKSKIVRGALVVSALVAVLVSLLVVPSSASADTNYAGSSLFGDSVDVTLSTDTGQYVYSDIYMTYNTIFLNSNVQLSPTYNTGGFFTFSYDFGSVPLSDDTFFAFYMNGYVAPLFSQLLNGVSSSVSVKDADTGAYVSCSFSRENYRSAVYKIVLPEGSNVSSVNGVVFTLRSPSADFDTNLRAYKQIFNSFLNGGSYLFLANGALGFSQNSFNEGYNAGMRDGSTSGYNEGYNAGVEKGFSDGVNSVADGVTPLKILANGVTSLLNVELLPKISFYTLIVFALSVVVIKIVYVMFKES